MLTCRSHDDCVIVEMGCCHYCNSGGWVLGVNRQSSERAKQLYADRCSASETVESGDAIAFTGTSCMDCGTPTVGFCERGACTWALGENNHTPPVPQPNRIRRRPHGR
jgi:hypothetical protein